MIKKTKISKPSDNSTDNSQIAKKVGDWEDYLNTNTFQMYPSNGSSKDRLAVELIEWSKLKTSYKISQFYIDKGILEETYYRWVASHENLSIAHKIALVNLGNRREIGAIERKLEPSIVKFTMPLYDKDWVKREKDVAQLNDKPEDSGTKFVVIENYSNAIDVKKDEEN